MQPLPLIREQRHGGARIDHLTCDLVRIHPGFTFMFDDNLRKCGKAGQAIIRYEPNAFGTPTKRLPSIDKLALCSDQAAENAACVPVDSAGAAWTG